MQDQPDWQPTGLPVGFESFHRQRFLNYQLNRAHSLGFIDAGDLRATAGSLRSVTDAPPVLLAAAHEAGESGRLRAAAGYLRLAEFVTPPSSSVKIERYRQFRGAFDVAVSHAARSRLDIPYREAWLPAYLLPSVGQRHGTVLLHGGFDSLIEEFVGIWERLALAGFDVVAYEGPGQGGARRLGGLTSDHDWERPVGAVLDRLDLDRVAVVGLSMGGYWALRAAAYEPRVTAVVAWPPVYDWMARVPAVLSRPTHWMLGRRRFMDASIRARASLVPTLRFVVDQACYLAGSDDPLAAMDWFLGMNAEHLSSQRVTQDVLLMVGEHDSFQPPALARRQLQALTSARSVTTRTFTAAEHADQHCQMGNLDLACSVLTSWLATKARW
jgi:pimeloyl-ACP methyl ester carboxylesterase